MDVCSGVSLWYLLCGAKYNLWYVVVGVNLCCEIADEHVLS